MSDFGFLVPVVCALLLIGLVWACISTSKKDAEARKSMSREERSEKDKEEQEQKRKGAALYMFGFMGKPPVN